MTENGYRRNKNFNGHQGPYNVLHTVMGEDQPVYQLMSQVMSRCKYNLHLLTYQDIFVIQLHAGKKMRYAISYICVFIKLNDQFHKPFLNNIKIL